MRMKKGAAGKSEELSERRRKVSGNGELARVSVDRVDWEARLGETLIHAQLFVRAARESIRVTQSCLSKVADS